jgi:hypothetical protein
MTHFDLTTARAQMAAQIAEDTQLDPERIKDGTDAQFVAANRRFDEHRIDFIIETMRCENDGLGRDQALAAGARCLGELLGMLTVSCVGARERQLVHSNFTRALGETIQGPIDPNQRVVGANITAEEGGNA